MTTPRAVRRSGWSGRAAAWLAATIILLWASGWLLHDGAAAELADLTDAGRGWRHAAIVTHGVLAWVFCGFVGRWVWPHLMRVWLRPTKRPVWVLGLLVAGALAVVAVTGLMLLYGSAQWREPVSALHWAFGLALPLLGSAHGWRWIGSALRGRCMPAGSAEEGSDRPEARSNHDA